MAEIDSLEIRIEAEAKRASDSIEAFSRKLDTLAKSLSSIDTGKLNSIAIGIRSIGDAATGFKKGKAAELSSLAGALKKFDGIDTNSMHGISSAMNSISESMRGMQGVDIKGFANVASAISKLGGKGATAGTQNLVNIKDDLATFARGMNQIGGLTFDTTGLSNLINSISRLGNKASTDAVKNLSPISAQLQNFVRQLNNIGSLSFDTTNLSNLINGISRLGGKSVTNAITNIPLLATALNNLMDTLSRAPVVSQNTIQMTQALANLAAQGSRVGAASHTIANGLNKTSDAMKRAKNSSKSLMVALGKLYAAYFLVARGVKFLMNSVESTTEYIEAFNYYNVAFGKIASEWSKDFDKYGYENADSYAKSFTDRINGTLGKLSGLQVNLETGLLEETGMQNLGLNIQEITQYASQLASVTNSIGQTGEVSLAAAKSMTMLAGDISSLFNVDFQDVANNLQSGLIGQSRALYKYGIDITNNTLATYAFNLGLEKSVSEMTQAEKMQLRMVAILDQSKVSWGDLANTIQSPSNMLRQFSNNVKEVSMVFGQLFIPVLQKVMPVINGITIAIKRLLVSFAQILGISIDFDAFGQGYGDMSEEADDLSDSLGGVAASAKKAKAGLRAFDELKVINMPDTSAAASGGGAGNAIDLTDEILKATEEYEKVWNEAFAKMENTAQEWADKIDKILEPVKKIFQDFAVGDFFQAGKDVSNLVVSITDFFAKAIDKVDWYGIGKKIGDFLAGIDWLAILKSVGNLIWQALKAAFELYVGAFSSAPLETAIISLVAMPGLLKAITASKFITGFKKLASGIKLVVTSLTGNKAANALLVKQYPKLSKVIDVAKDSFWALKTGIADKNFGTGLNLAISNIRNNLSGMQKAAIVAVAGFAEFSVVSSSMEKLTLGTENWLAEIGKIAGVAAAAGAAMYVALGPAGLAITAITGLVAGIVGITKAQEEMKQKLAEERELQIFGDHLSEITTRLNESAQATKNRMAASIEYVQNAGLGEMQMAKDLADRYFDLAEKEDITNAETEEMKRLAELLIEKAPELNQYYDEQTGLINGTRDAINGVIEARLREIELNAISEKLTEAYKERVETLTRLEEAADAVSKAQEEMKILQSEYDEAAKMEKAYNAYREIGELRGKGITQLDDSVASQILLNNAIEAGAEPTENLVELQERLKEILTENGEELPQNLYDATFKYSEQLSEAQSKIEVFSEKYKEAWDTLSEQKTALESTESTISQLSQMMSDGMQGVGEDFGEGYEKGILSKVEDVEAAANEMGDVGVFSLRESIESHSPSEATKRIGKDFAEGYNIGIESSTDDTIKTVSNYATNILKEFSTIVEPLKKIGVDAMHGLLNGLSSMESSIYSKSDEIANNIANTTKKALDIHSPSRVMFGLGDFTMQGFEFGLESRYKSILSSVEGFNYDFEIASAPSISGMYENYRYDVDSYIPQNSNGNLEIGNIERAVYTATYNAFSSAIGNSKLLNDILDEVEKGHTINLDGTPVYKSMVKRAADDMKNGKNNRLIIAEELYA